MKEARIVFRKNKDKVESVKPLLDSKGRQNGVTTVEAPFRPWLMMALLAVVMAILILGGADWQQVIFGAGSMFAVGLVVLPAWRLYDLYGGPKMAGALILGDGEEVIIHGRRQKLDGGKDGFVGWVRGRRGKDGGLRLDGTVRGAQVSTLLLEGNARRVGGIPMRYVSARSRMQKLIATDNELSFD